VSSTYFNRREKSVFKNKKTPELDPSPLLAAAARRRAEGAAAARSERLECLADVHQDLVDPSLVLALQPVAVVATAAEAGLRATAAAAPGAGMQSGRRGMRGPVLAALDADLADAGDLG
jgi:hypothetical protein